MGLDGCVASEEVYDLAAKNPSISLVHMEKLGESNHAGRIRNKCVIQARTRWVAFVDDDDSVAPEYVDMLRAEVRNTPDAQMVQFRMQFGTSAHILPSLDATTLQSCHVGISFALRYDTALWAPFESSGSEDWEIIDKVCRTENMKAVLSSHIAYFVRSGPSTPHGVGVRVENVKSGPQE